MRSSYRLGAAFLIILGLASAALAVEDLSSAQAAFLRGEYSQAASTSRAMLDRKPSGSVREELLYLKGVSELKLRDLEEARLTLTQLTSEFPEGRRVSQARMALGDLYALTGEDQKALDLYEELVKSGKAGSLLAQITFRVGDAQRRLGLWEEARKTLERVAAQFPRSPEGLQAKELLAQGEFAFFVQVGAFQSRENAVRLKTELERRHFSAEVNDTILEGRRFYRVRVGQFARREDASEEATRLREEGFPGKVVP